MVSTGTRKGGEASSREEERRDDKTKSGRDEGGEKKNKNTRQEKSRADDGEKGGQDRDKSKLNKEIKIDLCFVISRTAYSGKPILPATYSAHGSRRRHYGM